MKRTRIEMKAIPQLNNEVRVWDRLAFHTAQHTLNTVEVEEYTWEDASLEMVLAAISSGFYPQ